MNVICLYTCGETGNGKGRSEIILDLYEVLLISNSHWNLNLRLWNSIVVQIQVSQWGKESKREHRDFYEFGFFPFWRSFSPLGESREWTTIEVSICHRAGWWAVCRELLWLYVTFRQQRQKSRFDKREQNSALYFLFRTVSLGQWKGAVEGCSLMAQNGFWVLPSMRGFGWKEKNKHFQYRWLHGLMLRF